MTEPAPSMPRPAATVMLVRDTAEGIKVFLMRRHSAMEFVAGVMVFPGGGVDDRDRGAFTPGRSDPAREDAHRLVRPRAVLVGRPARRRRRIGRGAGLCGRPRDLRGVRRAVRRSRQRLPATRDRRRRVGVPRTAGRRWTQKTLSFARVPARREAGAARRPAAAVGELGDAQGGAHPPLRHLLLRRGAARGPARRRREHRDRPGVLGDSAGRPRRVRRGPVVPAAADLDAAGLAQRPHRGRGARRRTQDRRRRAASGRQEGQLGDRVLQQRPVQQAAPRGPRARQGLFGRQERSDPGSSRQ